MKRIRKPSEKKSGRAGMGGEQPRAASHAQRKRPRPGTHDRERQEAAAAAAQKRAMEEQVNQTVNAPSVTLHPQDKATQLVLSDDRMVCKGVEGGFRMARATHGVGSGDYYWECHILPSTDPDAHVRIGWSTAKGELQAPVGYDKYSFAYRDLAGSKVHNSHRVDHYGEPFGAGDIIGCYLSLSGHGDDLSKNEMRFFKNGKDQGVAYRGDELPSGAGWVYYPAVSLYMRAAVSVNFGPTYIVNPVLCDTDNPPRSRFINAVSELSPMSGDDRQVSLRDTTTATVCRASLLSSLRAPSPLRPFCYPFACRSCTTTASQGYEEACPRRPSVPHRG